MQVPTEECKEDAEAAFAMLRRGRSPTSNTERVRTLFVGERISTGGRVVAAGGVVKERIKTVGRVRVAAGVVVKRFDAKP